MTHPVDYALNDGVATLTMDDGKANAFGPAMIAALDSALDRAAREADAVVIAGRPGVLCAGFDLRIIRGDDDDARTAMRNAGRALLLKAYLHPQPLVFACTGHAMAAGALLLLTGDFRIGARGAFKIGLNETAIDLALPNAGLEIARDRLQPTHLSAATILATLYAPDDALSAGYLDAVAEPDAVLAAAHDRAVALSKLGADAVATTKRRLRQATLERIAAAES